MPMSWLGEINAQTGKTKVGGATGFPIEELVEAAVAPLDKKVTEIDDEISAQTQITAQYSKLNQYFNDIRATLNQLRKPSNYGKIYFNEFESVRTNINLFDARRLFVQSSNTNINVGNFIEFQAAPGTAIRNYEVSNIVTAKRQIQQATTVFADLTSDVTTLGGSPEPAKFAAGTFTINNGAASANVTLAAGDTLVDVVGKINEAGQSVNLEAYTMYNGSGYHFVLQAISPGTANDFSISDPSLLL
ncbi:MAG: flagellin hook IN motif-containing protein, partial [Pseudomonadota bacterium]